MRPRSNRRNAISGQFAARLVEMLESPAYRILSLSARRVLDRIEIEFAHHGGTNNGRLKITYDDFEDYGIHRHAIAPAIREAASLGFVKITERGCAGNAAWRRPNSFRLTYRHTDDAAGDGTHEWRQIKRMDQAIETADVARNDKNFTRSPVRKKKQKSSAGKRRTQVAKPITETALFPVAEIATPAIVRNPPRLSIFRDGSRSAPTQGAVASEPSKLGALEMIMKTHGCDISAAEAILEQLPDARPRSAVGNEIG